MTDPITTAVLVIVALVFVVAFAAGVICARLEPCNCCREERR
jgi:hypothetical protein